MSDSIQRVLLAQLSFILLEDNKTAQVKQQLPDPDLRNRYI